MLVTSRLEPFSLRPPNTLYIKICQFSYKPFGIFQKLDKLNLTCWYCYWPYNWCRSFQVYNNNPLAELVMKAERITRCGLHFGARCACNLTMLVCSLNPMIWRCWCMGGFSIQWVSSTNDMLFFFINDVFFYF